MGKGDKRTAKGKRVVGSYGNSRPKKKNKVATTKAVKSSKAVAKPKKKVAAK